MEINHIFYNRYAIAVTALLFFNLTITGCYSLREVTIENNETIKIYKLETVSGDTINFDKTKLGYATLIDDNIVSVSSNGEQELYPMSNVKKYYTEKFDTGKTILLVVGSAVALVVVWIGLIFVSMDGGGFGG
jgi:hypothetical protein